MAEEKNTILTKLNRIQTELKAGKNQYNKFGNFNYRSAEDILEGAKPLLKENNAVIILTDNPEILERSIITNGVVDDIKQIYIKATAKIIDVDSGQSIEASAYAREADSKKTMSAEQITGSASSYARKYALSGLLAIDDNKDSDFYDNRENGQQKAKAPAKANKKNNSETETQEKAKIYNEILELLPLKNLDSKWLGNYIKDNYATDKFSNLNLNQCRVLKNKVASM